MDIPIDVVRNGNAERYVEIQNELKELQKEHDNLIGDYNNSMENLFRLTVDRDRDSLRDIRPNYWHFYSKKNRWMNALTIEQYSKSLVETTGKMMELKAKIDDLNNKKLNLS